MVRKIESIEKGVKIEADREGKSFLMEGRKAILADGVNSRMVECLGLNRERKTNPASTY
jgi:flavin-dependent dehydrogenase